VAAADPLARDLAAVLEDDEEPPTDHACPYTIVGLSEEEKPIVRNSAGKLFRLLPI
jgi:hypothetical protein